MPRPYSINCNLPNQRLFRYSSALTSLPPITHLAPAFVMPLVNESNYWTQNSGSLSPLVKAASGLEPQQGEPSRSSLGPGDHQSRSHHSPRGRNPGYAKHIGQWDSERPLCTDRSELIARIKRGESPTWVPNQAFQEEYLRLNGEPFQASPARKQRSPSRLLPAAELATVKPVGAGQEHLHSPYEIEKPRSALHAGNFTEDANEPPNTSPCVNPDAGSSSSPSRKGPTESTTGVNRMGSSSLGSVDVRAPWSSEHLPVLSKRSGRSRAPSLSSCYSNYILKVPTTPLVQQSNNADLDLPRDPSMSPDRSTRRHTLPPRALSNWNISSTGSSVQIACSGRSPRPLRGEEGLPYGQHTRKSLTLNWSLQQPSSPPSPGFLRSRPTSFSFEASPRQQTSMVGSYEESILRGRMSTPPSKPFDFTAHIGALGKGKRPKMPPHVVIPFQAVFYDWSSNNGKSASNDEPSPYVGHIDLHQLGAKPSSSDANSSGNGHKIEISNRRELDRTRTYADRPPEKPRKRKRPVHRAAAPQASYRVPEQGQIQVVIKNPYKTALKLFLVPYDLTGMEPGQKTFVRQRYYSAGPTLEGPMVPISTQLSEQFNDPKKSTLRYLIHLNMCCAAKDHFYLYEKIRVVFANRVPDDKENLTKEIQEPNPKYSSWKPATDFFSNSSTGSKTKTAKVLRRRSWGTNYGDHVTEARHIHSVAGEPYPYGSTDTPPVPPLPFQLPPRSGQNHEHPGHDWAATCVGISRPTTSDLPYPSDESLAGASDHRSSDSGDSDKYAKLSKGDAGYGGVFGRDTTVEGGESLLAQRLRDLALRMD